MLAVELFRSAFSIVTKDKLSVFLFHKVPANVDSLQENEVDLHRFEQILSYVQLYFDIWPLAEAIQRLEQGALPKRCAAITFDDGYSDWKPGVVALLSRLSVPATFYITSGQFFGAPMWHERLAHIVRTCNDVELDTRLYRLQPLKLETLQDKRIALRRLEHHFKYLPIVIRDEWLLQLEDQIGVTWVDVPRMPIHDVIEISNLGFEIGAHTHEHPILGLCDAQRARNEVGKAREILEGIIKVPVRGFAYPNGRPIVDFSPLHVEMVKSAGYHYAVTTQWGAARTGSSVFQIPRFTPWGPRPVHMGMQLLRNLYVRPDALVENE